MVPPELTPAPADEEAELLLAVVEVRSGLVNEADLESELNVAPLEFPASPDEVSEMRVSLEIPMLTKLEVVLVPTALVRVCVNSPTNIVTPSVRPDPD